MRRLGFCALAACTLTTNLDGLSGGSITKPDASSPRDAGGISVQKDAAGTAGTSGSYTDVILADHPVAYFPFDEPAGTTTVLERIKGVTGKPDGDLVFGATGIAGTALRSNGNGGIDFGQLLEFTGEQAWSFEAWVFPIVMKGTEFYEYFNKREGTDDGIVVYIRNNKGIVTAQIEDSYGGGGRGVDTTLPALDHFFHIVQTYTPGKGVRAWVDGVASDFGYDDKGGPTPNKTPVSIASGISGSIDELAIYDYPLSDAQIAAHFAIGRKK